MAEYPPIQIPENLLNDDHLRLLAQALAIKDLAQKHLNDAKAVGFDTTQLQKTFDESMARLLAIRRTYFPGR